jgi:hypothetical protein
MKTHIMNLVNKDYLSAFDLMDSEANYQDVNVTVLKIEKRNIVASKGDKEKEKTLIFFKELPKPFILTNTTAKILWKQLGIEFQDQLIGAKFTLTCAKEKHFGEWMHVLRPKKIVEKLPTITDERFEAALSSIKEGKYTVEQLTKSFTLTAKQNEKLR